MKKIGIVLGLLLAVAALAVGCTLLLQSAQAPEPADPAKTQILFSEVCSKNESIISDNAGKYRDYIELYNAGQPVSLSGCYLTDGTAKAYLDEKLLHTGESWLVFLSKEETGFSLGASGGDCIQLIDSSGAVLTQVNTSALQEDQVMLYKNGEYQISYEASPGFETESQFRKGQKLDEPKVVISEILAKNESALPDEKGAYCDILELRNVSEEEVDLHGWWLSDSPEDRFGYRLPKTALAPGEYLVLYCDGENDISQEGNIHVNFGLSSSDTVVLTDRSGGYVSQEVVYCGEDMSLSLTENGYAPLSASPGYDNTEAGILQFQTSRINMEGALVISQVLLSGAGVPYNGQFCDVIEITNRSENTVSTENWYLSDGGDPYACPLEQKELKSGEKLVIVCGPDTTGFSVSEGEVLKLTGPDYKHLPPVVCNTQPHQSICLSDSKDIAYSYGPVSIGCESEGEFQKKQLSGELRISELMSANNSYLKGYYGATCDWLELYNPSQEAVNLSEYHITNNSGNLYKYQLPEQSLQPGEYCVIFLAKDTTNLSRNYPSVPFTLASEGEELYISKNGRIVDYVNLLSLDTDISYGRPQGEATFDILQKPTPGGENTEAAVVCAAPTANIPQGSYEDTEYLEIILEGEGEIYYTTDCTAPTRYSKRYTQPIRITKTTVIRAISISEGKKSSPIVDLTYLLNEGDTAAAVSIVTEPANLFSYETGIYVLGPNASEEFPFRGANFFMDWEREASVTLIETDGSIGFSSPCGIKIYGAYSRAYYKKSLTCFFRSRYGADTLNYPLFGDAGLPSYECFVVRACGQDIFNTRMKDELVTSLASEYTDLAVQKYRPVVLYLNGRYYGVHYIREKLNEHYFSGNYGADPEKVTICERNGTTSQEYLDLVEYAKTHDLSVQEHYDYVCSQMNTQVYMDYLISQIWLANEDNSNVKFFKIDGEKWHWILYDTDLTMLQADLDTVSDHLNPGGTGAGNYISTALINALLKNPEFYDAFMRRFAWHLTTVWTQENVTARVDYFAEMISEDMKKDCARWDQDYGVWQWEVNYLKRYIQNRTDYVLKYVQDYFHLTKAQMQEYGFPV